MTLDEAIAEVQSESVISRSTQEDIDLWLSAQQVIMFAVASGDLIPLADHRLAVALGVKPLEWWEAELPSRGGGKVKADAYTIRRIEGLWLLDFAGESRSDWRFTSLQGAKDHAQFLHTTRILSSLKDTTP